jgi:Zn-dependent protease/CBS domain-containing protein
MDGGVLKIATVGGIEIKVHWSWVLILLLVTFSVATGFLPTLMPGENPVIYWGLGFVAALLLFVSVLLHELSHSFMARARGLKVRDIVLFIFGGVSNIEEEPESAGDEFLIAVVGPFSSLVLAALFFGLTLVVSPPVRQVGAWAAALFLYLASINLMLGLFNMIPGFPLDGGRVLRSIVWAVTRNLQRATQIAGFIGQLVAYGFIFLGLYQFFVGGDGSGLWMAFIGWFLLNAARQSVSGVVMREKLRSITVGQVMQPAPPAGTPSMSLAQLLTQIVMPYNVRAVPIVENDRLVGIITLGDIKDVPQEQWSGTLVGRVMTPADRLRTVRPADDLSKALQLLEAGDFDQVPVLDPAGRLLGMLSRAHVLRWLQIREELKLGRPAPGAV